MISEQKSPKSPPRRSISKVKQTGTLSKKEHNYGTQKLATSKLDSNLVIMSTATKNPRGNFMPIT